MRDGVEVLHTYRVQLRERGELGVQRREDGMKKSVGTYEIRTDKCDVVVSLPGDCEILDVCESVWGARLITLTPQNNKPWVDWHFLWSNGSQAEGLSSENYVGTVRVGPGDAVWHLFLVDE
uniref:Uncharacterized protein n=1 Tax=viral metagenome TaxID=1070528 RepID=A0A6M3LJT0_9ZZZZ